MPRCRQCLISDSVPGADLDTNRLCRFCREDDPAARAAEEAARLAREDDLEQALRDCRGRGEYDCLVPLSGGKDSVYLLHRLKREYGLKVLAFTTDINIPPIAWDNIRRAVTALDIDHAVYRPSKKFYAKLFRHLLSNQEERGAVYTVSYVYAPLFEGDAIRLAAQKGIPLVLAGYSPGQPDPERMEYEFSPELIRETDWTPPALKASGAFDEEELAYFFNPTRERFPHGLPRYLAPYHAWPYSQEEVMRKTLELGLVKSARHANPVLTNYPIQWLLMYSDLNHFGYNPYLPEFATLIRQGKASRRVWRVLFPLVDFMIRHKTLLGREVSQCLRWLGMTESELAVALPRGAYDPPYTGGSHVRCDHLARTAAKPRPALAAPCRVPAS